MPRFSLPFSSDVLAQLGEVKAAAKKARAETKALDREMALLLKKGQTITPELQQRRVAAEKILQTQKEQVARSEFMVRAVDKRTQHIRQMTQRGSSDFKRFATDAKFFRGMFAAQSVKNMLSGQMSALDIAAILPVEKLSKAMARIGGAKLGAFVATKAIPAVVAAQIGYDLYKQAVADIQSDREAERNIRLQVATRQITQAEQRIFTNEFNRRDFAGIRWTGNAGQDATRHLRATQDAAFSIFDQRLTPALEEAFQKEGFRKGFIQEVRVDMLRAISGKEAHLLRPLTNEERDIEIRNAFALRGIGAAIDLKAIVDSAKILGAANIMRPVSVSAKDAYLAKHPGMRRFEKPTGQTAPSRASTPSNITGPGFLAPGERITTQDVIDDEFEPPRSKGSVVGPDEEAGQREMMAAQKKWVMKRDAESMLGISRKKVDAYTDD